MGNADRIAIAIAIVAALERELRPMRGKIGERAIFRVIGIGKDGAMRELPRLIAQHEPGVIILTGFAGGLQPGLGSGMPVLATALQHEGSCAEISLQNRFLELAATALEAARIPFRQGKVLTVERVVTSPEDKNRLWSDFSALAVEMEGWWVARAAGERPLICLKAIVDPAGWGLPRGLASMTMAMTMPDRRRRRALWALWAPWDWPGLLRLAWAARRAAGALAEAVACIVMALQAQAEVTR